MPCHAPLKTASQDGQTHDLFSLGVWRIYQEHHRLRLRLAPDLFGQIGDVLQLISQFSQRALHTSSAERSRQPGVDKAIRIRRRLDQIEKLLGSFAESFDHAVFAAVAY